MRKQRISSSGATTESLKANPELAKNLYRSVVDLVKNINDGRTCARSVSELFAPTQLIQRARLRDYCERLIGADPVLYARKAEELLWRKAFYDIVATAKQLRDQKNGDDVAFAERNHIMTHLNTGIGYYHYHLARLQSEFGLNLRDSIDFPLIDTATNKLQNSQIDVLQWAKQSAHRTLIYLGDLSRYKLDVSTTKDAKTAIKYYYQARFYDPDNGMPHNQLGNLASSLELELDAAYHYIQCMMSRQSFEGTENNLRKMFEKNAKFIEELPVDLKDGDCIIEFEPAERIKQLESRFLLLTDIWFFNKKVQHMYELCHQTNSDLQECLALLKTLTTEHSDDDSSSNDNGSTVQLIFRSDIAFKMAAICLMCLYKSRSIANSAQQTSNIVAFTLAVYLQLIQRVIMQIRDAVLNFPLQQEYQPSEEEEVEDEEDNDTVLEENGRGRKKKSRRRRKKINVVSDEESDKCESDHEVSDASIKSDVSENESDIESSSDDDDIPPLNSVSDGPAEAVLKANSPSNEQSAPTVTIDDQIQEALEKSRKINDNDMLNIIQDEHLLASIKILSDWLISDEEIVKSCGSSCRNLVSQIINLVNLLNIKWNSAKLVDVQTDINFDVVPLPEDYLLRGVTICNAMGGKGAVKLDWQYERKNRKLTDKEQVIGRVRKLVTFATRLCGFPEMAISLDEETGLFKVGTIVDMTTITAIITGTETDDAKDIKLKPINHKHDHNKRNQLMKMKHMGQLWLAAEVKDLENRVKGRDSLSPYLVIDIKSLTDYLHMVKNLVYSRKFIVVVPSVVLSALDDLKKEKQEARDAIRWLESQFHHGNRFFRAQRQQERLAIPLVKYPKKNKKRDRDRDTFIFMQVIECCHYLAAQQQPSLTVTLVTLLTGDSAVVTTDNITKDFSYRGLAQTAGVSLELITEFLCEMEEIQQR